MLWAMKIKRISLQTKVFQALRIKVNDELGVLQRSIPKFISCLNPDGAFYVFPSCKGLLNKKTKLKTDTDFVQKLLQKSNVAVVQG